MEVAAVLAQPDIGADPAHGASDDNAPDKPQPTAAKQLIAAKLVGVSGNEYFAIVHEGATFGVFIAARNNNRYIGEMLTGKAGMHGKGVLYWPSGDVYRGEWQDGHMHGYGEYLFASGDIYRGEFEYVHCVVVIKIAC